MVMLSFLSKIPCKTMIVVVALCYVEVQRRPESGIDVSWGYAEFFPLSSLPMFSTFSDAGNLVYVADGDGKPILPETFHSSTGGLSKSYRKYLREERDKLDLKITFSEMTAEQKSGAGNRLLLDLRESIAPDAFADGKLPKVQMIELIITRDENGETVEKPYLVGELVTEGGAQ